jgi:hypothetical protein
MKEYGGQDVEIHIFLTFHDPAALPLGKEPPVPIGWEVGWNAEMAWKTWRRENS